MISQRKKTRLQLILYLQSITFNQVTQSSGRAMKWGSLPNKVCFCQNTLGVGGGENALVTLFLWFIQVPILIWELDGVCMFTGFPPPNAPGNELNTM